MVILLAEAEPGVQGSNAMSDLHAEYWDRQVERWLDEWESTRNSTSLRRAFQTFMLPSGEALGIENARRLRSAILSIQMAASDSLIGDPEKTHGISRESARETLQSLLLPPDLLKPGETAVDREVRERLSWAVENKDKEQSTAAAITAFQAEAARMLGAFQTKWEKVDPVLRQREEDVLNMLSSADLHKRWSRMQKRGKRR